jgi:hypothetical protein
MRQSWRAPGLRYSVVVAVLLCLLAGCAARPADDPQGRSGGFYGGLNGGVSRP